MRQVKRQWSPFMVTALWRKVQNERDFIIECVMWLGGAFNNNEWNDAKRERDIFFTMNCYSDIFSHMRLSWEKCLEKQHNYRHFTQTKNPSEYFTNDFAIHLYYSHHYCISGLQFVYTTGIIFLHETWLLFLFFVRLIEQIHHSILFHVLIRQITNPLQNSC